MELGGLISKCLVSGKCVNAIAIRFYGTYGQGLNTCLSNLNRSLLLFRHRVGNKYTLFRNFNITTKMSVSDSMEHQNSIKKYTYEETITALNNLQTNASVLKEARNQPYAAPKNLNLTTLYLEKVGIEISDLSKLNAVHIAGTKGKGSTCAFTESILRKHGLKTGFYSSPHLMVVRERIRINGKPISEVAFVKYFWEVYSKLSSNQDGDLPLPCYFMYLTVLSFYSFLQEKVDVAIVEVGIGGEYDCTNVLKSPVVVGVTSIGIDHVDLLGNSVEEIAFHKSGIFKQNIPAFTITQPPGVLTIFQNRAREIGCPLSLCPSLNAYSSHGDPIYLGLSGPVQKTNAALALQIANCWLQRMGKQNDANKIDAVQNTNFHTIQAINHAEPFPVSREIASGLKSCEWLGRFQTVRKDSVTYFLDGAHTFESISLCLEWFINASKKESVNCQEKVFRALLFNSTGSRKSELLLSPLTEVEFDVALFTPNVGFNQSSNTSSDRSNLMVEPQHQHQQCEINRNIWCYLQSGLVEEKAEMSSSAQGHQSVMSLSEEPCPTVLFTSISDALDWINQASLQSKVFRQNNVTFNSTDCAKQRIHVLVTGSLHLVGGVLAFIQPEEV